MRSITFMGYLQQGTAAYRRANLALFIGGCVTFAVLYATQPLLPLFASEFALTPAVASLSISVTTGALSFMLLVAGTLSEGWGRKPLMTCSLFAAAVLVLLTAFSPTFTALLVVRALQGVALAGVPAIAMAYLSEEVEPRSLGVAMGLYISGNAIGGMSGRFIIGALTDLFSWRIALGTIGVAGLLLSVGFWRLLPPSRHFERRPLALGSLTHSLVGHLRDPGLLSLYGISFLLMGGFVTLYNYIGFQLLAPPYNWSVAAIGAIFLIYLVGTFSSTWMGRLADRHGRRRVLWTAVTIMLAGAGITITANLPVKILGICIFTFGFFGAHSIASSWVGRRATHERGQAASLYLFFYYMGASIGGALGGLFWGRFGWSGVVTMIACFLVVGLAIAARLATIPPIAQNLPTEPLPVAGP